MIVVQQLLPPREKENFMPSTRDADAREMPSGFTPSEFDVLVGWARQNFHHEGNRRFRNVIESYTRAYEKANSKIDRGAIISKIVDDMKAKSPSGTGFLKLNPYTARWTFIGTEKAKDKVGHALRKALANDPVIGKKRKGPTTSRALEEYGETLKAAKSSPSLTVMTNLADSSERGSLYGSSLASPLVQHHHDQSITPSKKDILSPVCREMFLRKEEGVTTPHPPPTPSTPRDPSGSNTTSRERGNSVSSSSHQQLPYYPEYVMGSTTGTSSRSPAGGPSPASHHHHHDGSSASGRVAPPLSPILVNPHSPLRTMPPPGAYAMPPYPMSPAALCSSPPPMHYHGGLPPPYALAGVYAPPRQQPQDPSNGKANGAADATTTGNGDSTTGSTATNATDDASSLPHHHAAHSPSALPVPNAAYPTHPGAGGAYYYPPGYYYYHPGYGAPPGGAGMHPPLPPPNALPPPMYSNPYYPYPPMAGGHQDSAHHHHQDDDDQHSTSTMAVSNTTSSNPLPRKGSSGEEGDSFR